MAETVRITGSLEDLQDYYMEQGWGDGLPVMPPTEEAVDRMLQYTDFQPDDVIAILPPYRAEATVHNIAVNAVMAGCRPEYFPVVLAAVEATGVDEFNLYGIQATTNPVTTLIVVNGPLARELNFNAKGNCFGPGWRANATVGRAVRLCMVNIGGGIPQTMDKSTHGQPGKFGMCIAENEEDSPWEPLHVERGFQAEESCVTAFSVTGTNNVLDLASKSARGILRTFCSSCVHVGAQNVQLGGGPLIAFCPEHAEILAASGFSKHDVRRFLYENSRIKIQDFPPETLNGMVRHRRPKWYSSEHPESTVPLADSPEDIFLIVAGGPGPHSVVMPSFGEATVPITKLIRHKDGKPVRTVTEFAG